MKKNYIRFNLVLTVFFVLNTFLIVFIPIFLDNTSGFNEKGYIKLSSPEKTPLWNYTTGGSVNQVAISSNGKYIAVGSNDDSVYLFNNSILALKKPMWNYTTMGNLNSVAMSLKGDYIVAGSDDFNVYLFFQEVPPEEVPGIIPFGNFYLLFIIIGLISAVVLTKKKVILYTKS